MLVNRQDIIALKNLSITNNIVAIDTIPDAFKSNFQQYFFGKTLLEKDNNLYAYPHDIKNWIRFLLEKSNVNT